MRLLLYHHLHPLFNLLCSNVFVGLTQRPAVWCVWGGEESEKQQGTHSAFVLAERALNLHLLAHHYSLQWTETPTRT